VLYDQVRLRRNAVTRLALQRCDLVAAVARADPVGLHAFIGGYQELRELGVPPGRVRLAVNQLRAAMVAGATPSPSAAGGSAWPPQWQATGPPLSRTAPSAETNRHS
jgi:hypothetical protein